MATKTITELIQTRTLQANKTYGFEDTHNPQLPADYWFQHPMEGFTLFIVFYTQACRWAKCLGCNLPSKMSQYHISFDNIMKQIDFIFDFLLSPQQKQELRKIIISNNGSVLDEETFSTTALMYFLAKMNIHCPNISVLAMETRAEYVDMEELEVLARAIKEGQTPTNLELTMGFEAFDDSIRNEHFYKGLTLDVFDNTAEMAAKHGFKLKAYFMLKPVPGISEQDAIEDVKNGINYLDRIARKYDLDINMHLNPTYAAIGTALEQAFHKGEYIPPTLESLRKAVLAARDKKISVFVGLNDEGLAVPGGSFIREGDETLVKRFEQFNRTQDFSVLE